MQRYLNYLISLFSYRKILYKDVSLFSYWDENSNFTKYTKIGPFVRLFNSHVGKYSRVSKGCSLLFTSIGNFCSLSDHVQLGAGRHPLNYASTSQLFYNYNSLSNQWVRPISLEQNLPITIGSDVWIGSRSLVMGGVNIGHGAVVGSRALVTKNVPPYAIVAGVPAKVIKYRFSQEIIDRLLQIQWWEFNDKKIHEHIDFFRDPDITLEKLDIYFPIKN